MFEMHPGTLEMAMARRREILRSSARSGRGGERLDPRAAGVLRIRHAVASIATLASIASLLG